MVGAPSCYFTDIDKLFYEIEEDDVYPDFYEYRGLSDFSDYLKDSWFYDPVYKKVIGKMKDKVRGNIINEFFGLKSRCMLWSR